MADALGVALRTLERWAKVHDGFRRSLRGGKVESDQVVSESLYRRAQGYAYDEEQAFKVKEVVYENGARTKEVERIQIVTVHRVLPPDTTAMIFWLKNRRPIEWRDRREIVLSDAELDKMTDEQLRALAEGKTPTGLR